MLKLKKKSKILNVVLNSLSHLDQFGNKNPCNKHIVLTFSGFLSQQDCSLEGWSQLNDVLDPRGISCFDVKWESILYTDISKNTLTKVGKFFLLGGASLLIPSGGVFTAVKVIQTGLQLKELFYDSIALPTLELFLKAIDNAKQTGKLLAIALALGFPFFNQTISLIGFSLGSQVIKSTIQTLHEIGVHDLVQNVHFLGGACKKLSERTEFWSSALQQTVGGRATNTYSTEDKVLQDLYKFAKGGNTGIGNEPQLVMSENNASTKLGKEEIERRRTLCPDMKVFRLKNYKCTLGHMQYRENILSICKQISLEEK
ncbi:hypothetical protein FGO68_gene8659 [Halteria grandinella]|uniref:DUF726 domain-containing protein n=1 Tax=Halteria grandinella TaxID=5974 RepID=A0A8J8NEI3_HALGN|nr:hypothetical protein FGO68_gene8659 [Halteria grandinella]